MCAYAGTEPSSNDKNALKMHYQFRIAIFSRRRLSSLFWGAFFPPCEQKSNQNVPLRGLFGRSLQSCIFFLLQVVLTNLFRFIDIQIIQDLIPKCNAILHFWHNLWISGPKSFSCRWVASNPPFGNTGRRIWRYGFNYSKHEVGGWQR